MCFLLVMFTYHVDHDCQRDHEWCVYTLGDINGIAVAEDGELAADLREQVAGIVGDAEIPAPDVTVNVEGAITGLDLEALAEEPELLMHAGPKLAIAVDFIMGHQRENTLLDTYKLLSRIAIKDGQVIADVKEFALHLENSIACIVTHDESFSKRPCAFSDMETHKSHLLFTLI